MKRKIVILLLAGLASLLTACTGESRQEEQAAEETQAEGLTQEPGSEDMVTEGTEEYRGFILDNVLHS